MERIVRDRKDYGIYCIHSGFWSLSIIGIYQIDISRKPIEDMAKNGRFFQDIRFFETGVSNGIMPCGDCSGHERPKGVLKLPNPKKMDELGTVIHEEFLNFPRPVSPL